MGQESGHCVDSWILCSSLLDLKSRCWLMLQFSCEAGGPLPSSLISGRIHSIAPGGLRSLFSCWFLAGSCSQPRESLSDNSSQTGGLLSSWRPTGTLYMPLVPLMFQMPLASFFCHRPEKMLCFYEFPLIRLGPLS